MYARLLIALAVLAAPFAAAPAQADTLTWKIRSLYPYQVYLEFYSQRYDRAWPGGDQVYVLKDSNFHTYRLECETGEQICYGAWVTTDENTYWGVGAYDEHGCDACCRTCGGRYSDSTTLTE